MITTISAIGSAMRRPAKMNGAAAGITTRRSAAAREAPMLAADHSSTRLTPRAPWLVTMTIGYRHSRNTSATFDRLPMPKTKMKIGNSASFGTA
jgi:hypothetical protein